MLWQLYGLLTGWELHKVCFNLHISICEYEELVGVCTLLHSCTQPRQAKPYRDAATSPVSATPASCLQVTMVSRSVSAQDCLHCTE